MENFKEYFNEVQETLMECEDGMEKIEVMMEYAKELKEFPKEEMIKDNLVRGCSSIVYISAVKDDYGNLQYRGYSEALVVKGYVAILVEGLSGLKPETIINEVPKVLDEFSRETNIKASLSPSRANAFSSIVNAMIERAMRFRD